MTANPDHRRLREDALAIWRFGVEAVRSERLVAEALRVEGEKLRIGEEAIDLGDVRRLLVVGAGKAGAGMAEGVETAMGPRLLEEKQVAGWINVPEDCLRPLARIHLHPARGPGVNEPTEAGVRGTAEILRRVESLGPDDLCLCLISGGGSALMPGPVEAITLEDKLAVTRYLSAAGANIEQLNTVRKQLSLVKGGGLARVCRAGRLVSLIISDVLGDPLDLIASGPTVEDASTPEEALAILEQFDAASSIPESVFEYLRAKGQGERKKTTCKVRNVIIGNNGVAVDAAGREAERLGYSHAMQVAGQSEGQADAVGRHLAEMALRMRSSPGPDCLITGGEPVVKLVEASRRGLGGRNQQLVLAALDHLGRDGAEGIALLSGGTDGEDGPTDAAGALLDHALWAAAREQRLDPTDFLARNDAYHFFDPLGGLIRTGPTHTNVCDLRVVVVDRDRGQAAR